MPYFRLTFRLGNTSIAERRSALSLEPAKGLPGHPATVGRMRQAGYCPACNLNRAALARPVLGRSARPGPFDGSAVFDNRITHTQGERNALAHRVCRTIRAWERHANNGERF